MTTISVRHLPAQLFLHKLYFSIPNGLRRLVPKWYVTGGFAVLSALLLQNWFLFEIAGIFWYSMILNLSIHHSPDLSKAFKRKPWLIGLIYSPLVAMVSLPAFAQAAGGECTGGGIFGGIVTFVARTLQSLTLIGGSGSVAGYVCQLVSILVVSILLGFIASAGYTAYAMNQGQNFVAIIQPLVGILAFVVLVNIIAAALIGGGGATP